MRKGRQRRADNFLERESRSSLPRVAWPRKRLPLARDGLCPDASRERTICFAAVANQFQPAEIFQYRGCAATENFDPLFRK